MRRRYPDVDLDDVRRGVGTPLPDVIEELNFADDLPRSADQVLQQHEFLRGECDLGPGQVNLAGRRIHRQFTQGQHGGAGRRPAAEQGAEPGQQHDERERFGQIVVGTAVQPIGLVVFAVLGREHQDRYPLLLGAQGPDHLIAGQPGQHHIEDDGVIAAVPGGLEARGPVRAHVDHEALGRQSAAQGRGQSGLVLDHQ